MKTTSLTTVAFLSSKACFLADLRGSVISLQQIPQFKLAVNKITAPRNGIA
jgi:hypothetical protein